MFSSWFRIGEFGTASFSIIVSSVSYLACFLDLRFASDMKILALLRYFFYRIVTFYLLTQRILNYLSYLSIHSKFGSSRNSAFTRFPLQSCLGNNLLIIVKRRLEMNYPIVHLTSVEREKPALTIVRNFFRRSITAATI